MVRKETREKKIMLMAESKEACTNEREGERETQRDGLTFETDTDDCEMCLCVGHRTFMLRAKELEKILL